MKWKEYLYLFRKISQHIYVIDQINSIQEFDNKKKQQNKLMKYADDIFENSIGIIAYSTTSHGIWKFVSHPGDSIPRSEAE